MSEKLEKALQELKAVAEKEGLSAEIIDNKVVIDGTRVIEIAEGSTPKPIEPPKLPQIDFLDPVYLHPSGQERRRERRAKERKNKRK